jgi:predicted ATP-binding protein involved in virulence
MRKQKTRRTSRNRTTNWKQAHPTTGAYFLSFEIENVRCFSAKQTLDLSEGNGRPARWTILLGENGTGKTTTLQLLAAYSGLFELRSGFIYSRNARDELEILAPGIERVVRGEGKRRPHISVKTVDRLKLTGAANRMRTHVWTWDCTREMPIPGCIDTADPIVCYAYGAGRRSRPSSLNREEYQREHEGIFFEETALLNAEEWLLRLDYSASKQSRIQEQQTERLELVKGILVNLLPDVSDIRFSAPVEMMPSPTVEFKTPYGWVQLGNLGYGYRTMISWVVDLASRLVEQYPDSADPLAEPAVVLVDEIDLHLHPKWQKELIGFLTERFPNAQFIVTAHSPLIVQSATDANIALLKREGDHVVIQNNPETIRGWRIDQILTSDLFGLETARPVEFEKPLLRRKELLTQPKLTKSEREELKKLDAQLQNLPTGESFEQAKRMELIEHSLDMLRAKLSTKP